MLKHPRPRPRSQKFSLKASIPGRCSVESRIIVLPKVWHNAKTMAIVHNSFLDKMIMKSKNPQSIFDLILPKSNSDGVDVDFIERQLLQMWSLSLMAISQKFGSEGRAAGVKINSKTLASQIAWLFAR